MAQNLDELTLKIEADASEANAALDGLIGKLGELSKALTQVKGNTKINVTTRQVNSLSQSVNSSSRAATRFGAAFTKSFSTLGNYNLILYVSILFNGVQSPLEGVWTVVQSWHDDRNHLCLRLMKASKACGLFIRT